MRLYYLYKRHIKVYILILYKTLYQGHIIIHTYISTYKSIIWLAQAPETY